jgi:hypothetical protein
MNNLSRDIDLTQLAQLLQLVNQQKRIPTVNVGGHNLLVKEPRINRIGGALQNLIVGSAMIQQGQKKRQFLQGIQSIMTDPTLNTPELKRQKFLEYYMQAPDIAKSLGFDEVFKLLQPSEYKPTTQEELLELRRAEAGIKAESPQEKIKEKRTAFAESTKVREEFLNRPEVKEFVSINTNVRAIDRLVSESGAIKNKVALDQALITMFNKLTDPNSVVRESEYARTPENLPLVNRFSGALQKLQKGGAGLTDDDRRTLVWGARVIANERGRTYNETYQGYVDLANQYGIEESLITRGLSQHKEYPLDIGKSDNKVNQLPQIGDTLFGQKVIRYRRVR